MRYILAFFYFLPVVLFAQPIAERLQNLQSQRQILENQLESIDQQIETLKLQQIQKDLLAIGLPSDNYIKHTAMFLEYDEDHEQPKWVTHIITPDIVNGKVGRTNDFRSDSKVSTGSAVEADYFLKELQPDSSYTYVGFGYDRGHLAPSADFRWSYTAVSESYLYSNMSPQKADFNREKWGELEALLRSYVYRHQTHSLYVVTLPLLTNDLPVIERSLNKVSIPRKFIKVAIDPIAQQGIAFIMPNKRLSYPLSSFALTIDEAEQLTGYDFFNALDPNLQNQIESNLDKEHWFPTLATSQTEPINPSLLPRGHFNTIEAKRYIDKKIKVTICGKVVSGRVSRSGNTILNLDQKYPNSIFSIFIPKEEIVNFPYDPLTVFINDTYCFKGVVDGFMDHPSMKVKQENQIKMFKVKS